MAERLLCRHAHRLQHRRHPHQRRRPHREGRLEMEPPRGRSEFRAHQAGQGPLLDQPLDRRGLCQPRAPSLRLARGLRRLRDLRDMLLGVARLAAAAPQGCGRLAVAVAHGRLPYPVVQRDEAVLDDDSRVDDIHGDETPAFCHTDSSCERYLQVLHLFAEPMAALRQGPSKKDAGEEVGKARSHPRALLRTWGRRLPGQDLPGALLHQPEQSDLLGILQRHHVHRADSGHRAAADLRAQPHLYVHLRW
mmetsp:Transcript_86127/g.248636  ORF Transcript_86127/g.248636 Transcript_86127/m.248636 type:complete len:249 (-) Transcript_86127:402-1148(-)